MLIGVPTEVKNNEYRVAATPAGVGELVALGHEVLVEKGAGLGSAFEDAEYATEGAQIVESAEEVWARSEMILKVKEPIASEYSLIREDHIIFTYLHLAADRPLTEALVASGATAIAYETVQLANHSLPLLSPMSVIAGRLSAQVGANQLMKTNGGRGLLLGGIPGVPRGRTVVVGGGTAGENAAANALGLGAEVTILDVNLPRLAELEARFDGHITTLRSSPHTVAEAVQDADLVIGSVLIPGAAAPKLVTDDMVAGMKPGSVLVDIAIDQGGCFEGSRPTTHDDPTYAVHNSTYYCVANMPGAVPRTSTIALTNATISYAIAIAEKGWEQAVADDKALAKGLNIQGGKVVNRAVAAAHGLQVG
ncbi:alanine dehydrogenase [Ancrocorticia populi]|uniref:Alanine dehydrogenase n=1 Tax=Ancrocorticia populi TaxID=2175228 RepID=A0A2V1K9V6_9ACTO|nr:alanine dehydrogenase [Ancrocorticia populi]PWF26146.1 alanine dehydrogenase [Ancrocorticia populi]